jgi:hypothetical protein
MPASQTRSLLITALLFAVVAAVLLAAAWTGESGSRAFIRLDARNSVLRFAPTRSLGLPSARRA